MAYEWKTLNVTSTQAPPSTISKPNGHDGIAPNLLKLFLEFI
jgi:hypothetical protein